MLFKKTLQFFLFLLISSFVLFKIRKKNVFNPTIFKKFEFFSKRENSNHTKKSKSKKISVIRTQKQI